MDPFGDGVGDVDAEEPGGGKIPPRGPAHRLKRSQHPRADHGGDGIGGIVKPIDEIKCQRGKEDQRHVGVAKNLADIAQERVHISSF